MKNLEQISDYTCTFINIIGGSDDYKGSHPFGISKNMKKLMKHDKSRRKEKKKEIISYIIYIIIVFMIFITSPPPL